MEHLTPCSPDKLVCCAVEREAVAAAEEAAEREKLYSRHGWNINNLPRHQGSVLRYLEGDELITGVQVRPPHPYLLAVVVHSLVRSCIGLSRHPVVTIRTLTPLFQGREGGSHILLKNQQTLLRHVGSGQYTIAHCFERAPGSFDIAVAVSEVKWNYPFPISRN